MVSILEWLPPAVVSVTFLTLAGLKIYGFSQGVVGGEGQSARCRLLGRCPSWSNRGNMAMVGLFLVIGVLNFIWAAWAMSGGLVDPWARTLRKLVWRESCNQPSWR